MTLVMLTGTSAFYPKRLQERLPDCANKIDGHRQSERARSAQISFAVPVKRLSIPVSMGPGATALTRTPEPAASSAADLVMPSTACLLPT